MMSITIDVEDLLQQRIVESSRIEYKKDWNPSTIIHSICAFANDIEIPDATTSAPGLIL